MLHPVKKTHTACTWLNCTWNSLTNMPNPTKRLEPRWNSTTCTTLKYQRNYNNNSTEFNHMSNLLFKQHNLHTMEMVRKLVKKNIEFNEQCIPILISTACARLKGLGHSCKGLMKSWQFEIKSLNGRIRCWENTTCTRLPCPLTPMLKQQALHTVKMCRNS